MQKCDRHTNEDLLNNIKQYVSQHIIKFKEYQNSQIEFTIYQNYLLTPVHPTY